MAEAAPRAGHDAQNAEHPDSGDDFPIVIIGAGFAGIGMGIQLLKAGIRSFRIFERADGGTVFLPARRC